MEEKKKNTPTVMEINGLPEDFIKVKYTYGPISHAFDMAGFEAGDPIPKIERDPMTGKRKFVVRMNGFVHIEKNGDGLILNTIFNLRKLQILTKSHKVKVPKDSTGEEFIEKDSRPMFTVEDESIFDGLDDDEKDLKKVVAVNAKKPKGLVSVKEIEMKKAMQEAEMADNEAGVGGGRRPDATIPLETL